MATIQDAPQKAALIVVDMQEDFCEPDGSLAVKGGRELGPIINNLLSFPGFSMKIATQDFHPLDHISFASQHGNAQPFTSTHTIPNPENEEETQTIVLWPDHCVENTKGSTIIPEIDTSKLTHIVKKGGDKRVESYSGFGPPFRKPAVAMSNLNSLLQEQNITDVFCVGLAFDFCVKCTAIDAVEHGYRSFLIEEASKGVVQSDEAVETLKKEFRDKGVTLIGLDSDELRRLQA